jgi:hypothetical protein
MPEGTTAKCLGRRETVSRVEVELVIRPEAR